MHPAKTLSRLFPDPEKLREHLQSKVGRPVSDEEIEELSGPFLSPLQRAWLNAAGWRWAAYPIRKRFERRTGQSAVDNFPSQEREQQEEQH